MSIINPSRAEIYVTKTGTVAQQLGLVVHSSLQVQAFGSVKTVATTLSLLGRAVTAGAGSRAFCTDANLVATGNFGATIAGSSGNTVPVYSDGTNWRIG